MHSTWEAETRDGTIITIGGDLSDCVRFSLIGPVRHDFCGIRMERRFIRRFKMIPLGHGIPKKLLAAVQQGGIGMQDLARIAELKHEWQERITEYKAARKNRDYHGSNAAREKIALARERIGNFAGVLIAKYGLDEEVYHCLVAETFRAYINDKTGAILITPKDFELYI